MRRRDEIRVLIIDDSAYNRKTVAGFLAEVPGITIVGKASDGEEGLRMALLEKPDVITVDLEMPRMDGFTFLRLLMAKQPTPVIVISSHAEQENVFRALELGALDFVAKPTHRISPELRDIRHEVIEKVLLARLLKRETRTPLPAYDVSATVPPEFVVPLPAENRLTDTQPMMLREPGVAKAEKIVVIASSTGGPAAITQILIGLPRELDCAVIIAQHMPPLFTTTFAERLDRQSRLRVQEVRGVESLKIGCAYIAPGDACLEVNQLDSGLCVVAMPPEPTDRYIPSADRLFSSLAVALPQPSRALGIVLTGMGDDGADGSRNLAEVGIEVIAEDESTAVIAGMPRAAVATGAVTQVVRLEYMAAIITNFASGLRSV